MKAVGCFAFLAASVPLTIYRGWVLSVLWGWFVGPLFGAPPLTIPFAIGLSLIVGFLTSHYRREPKVESNEWWEPMAEQTAWAALHPTIALGFGWVVAQFLESGV